MRTWSIGGSVLMIVLFTLWLLLCLWIRVLTQCRYCLLTCHDDICCADETSQKQCDMSQSQLDILHVLSVSQSHWLENGIEPYHWPFLYLGPFQNCLFIEPHSVNGHNIIFNLLRRNTYMYAPLHQSGLSLGRSIVYAIYCAVCVLRVQHNSLSLGSPQHRLQHKCVSLLSKFHSWLSSHYVMTSYWALCVGVYWVISNRVYYTLCRYNLLLLLVEYFNWHWKLWPLCTCAFCTIQVRVHEI